jgi:hypothetical protein
MKTNNDRKISDILWDAANEYLSEVDSVHLRSEGYGWKERYSCSAVEGACYSLSKSSCGSEKNHYSKTIDFLEELGVNTGDLFEFIEFDAGEERQGARYLWLMFAYQVALSEGV